MKNKNKKGRGKKDNIELFQMMIPKVRSFKMTNFWSLTLALKFLLIYDNVRQTMAS